MTDRSGQPSTRSTRFLRSRVARRIFFLFVACALLPLLLLAGVSLYKVREQLQQQAAARLHDACKSTGMTIVERLMYLQDDLRAVAERSIETGGTLGDTSRVLRERVERRFRWIAVATPQGHELDRLGPVTAIPPLADVEHEHLSRSAGLLKFVPSPEAAAAVFVVTPFGAGEGRFLFGEVRGDYLWSGEEVLAPNTDLLVLAESGERLFATSADRRLPELLTRFRQDGTSRHQLEWRDAQGRTFLTSHRTMFVRPQLCNNFLLAHSEPLDSVFAPAESFETLFLLVCLLTLLGVVLASLMQIRRSLVPIDVLKAATARIRERDFSARAWIDSNDEFRDLGASFNAMAEGLESYLHTLHTLHRIGVALTAEKSSGKLIEIVVAGAQSVVQCDLAAAYLSDENGGLHPAQIGVETRGRFDSALALEVAAVEGGGDGTVTAVRHAAATGETIAIEDITRAHRFDATPYRALEKRLGYEVRSVLCVPMKNHEDEIIGVLQLLNATDRQTGEIRAFSLEEQQIAESLASQAAVAVTKNRLIDEFRDLFESLTELLATAIDEKSKYTGDHCRRVPILTMMLAEEACAATDGPFRDFALTDDEMYELKVAALLHDCGKVVTPVHVVDKATKLETLFDRIALIDTRFEVLKRDFEIAWLRERLAATASAAPEQATGQLAARLQDLEDDRAFLRTCNVGSEWMPPAARARIAAIGERYQWRDPEGRQTAFLTADEIENLSVMKGTLTGAERQVVNYHVVATIKMLEQLPYPRYLRRVPAIAGAHHEKMNGTGYPLGLDRSQIAPQGRILGIADVFEALTAKDRPYKKGKTLTETLTILGRMKEDGHIDPDLFQLLIDSGVYLRYARQYLDADQIDEVDLTQIPGYVPADQTATADA